MAYSLTLGWRSPRLVCGAIHDPESLVAAVTCFDFPLEWISYVRRLLMRSWLEHPSFLLCSPATLRYRVSLADYAHRWLITLTSICGHI